MTALFKDFEVNWEHRTPTVLKLVAWSVLVHVLSLAVLLSMPGVRNLLSFGSLIADTAFVEKDYERTEIGDDVQFVEVSSEKFHYPAGYWAMEGQPGMPLATQYPPPPPSQIIVQSQPQAPVMAPSPPLPEVSATPTPTPSPAATGSPLQTVAEVKASPNASPNSNPTPGPREIERAEKELDRIAQESNLTLPKEGEINKKALKDFAAYANDLKNQGKLDLEKPFEVVIEAELDANGKLQNPRFTKKEGDPNLVELFGRMVAAMNDSGLLVYLKPIDKDNPGTKVVFTIKQGDKDVLASVEAELTSNLKAAVMAGSFNAMLQNGALTRAGKDEEVLLKNTVAAPNGKKLTFNFTMPRDAVVELIKKQLSAG